jgi:hypothetical protein
MSGSTDALPMPSTNEALYSIFVGSPRSQAAASGAAVSTSAAQTRTPGIATAMPHARPPPPYGTMTSSTSDNCSRISNPTVPLPAMTRGSADRMHEKPVGQRLESTRAAPLATIGQTERRTEMHPDAQSHLVWQAAHVSAPRRSLREASARGDKCHCLCHVACRCSVDAGGQLLIGVGVRQSVGGAAHFERADRLQTFAFQIDFIVGIEI